MGKLKCTCGYVISDTYNNLPHRADLYPDKSREEINSQIVNVIKSFLEAKEKGESEQWMQSNFKIPPYPTDLPDQEMIWDLIHDFQVSVRRAVFQCNNCARLWIQRGQDETFVPFTPDSDDAKNILDYDRK